MKHRPRKHWGQHFLHERRAIERIIETVGPGPDDRMLEVGAGEGVLTRPLLATAGRVDVIEIDRDLARQLRELPDPRGVLHVHVGDALAFEPRTIATDGPIRVLGNLPYNISTPILFLFLERLDIIRDLHLMLQREVVERMAAPAGAPGRGRLSVMLQAQCRVETLFHLRPGAFRPPPKVDSTVVRLTPLATPAIDPAAAADFATVVRLAFGGRRKTLRRTLAPVLDTDAITACGVDPGLRPERLSVTDFAALGAALAARRKR